MAAISSGVITAAVPLNPSNKLTSFSSSSSLFFSYSISSRAGLKLAVDRPRKRGFSCNCLFGLGVPELVVIAGVTVLLFGPKQLPEVGRSIGKTVKSFQQAAKEFESELKKDVVEPEPSMEPSTTPVGEGAEEKQEVKATSTIESSPNGMSK